MRTARRTITWASTSSEGAVPLEANHGRDAKREDVLTVADDGGAISLEFVPLREGIARVFMRQSPRVPRLGDSSVSRFFDELERRPYSRIIAQDSRKGLLRKLVKRSAWRVRRAVQDQTGVRCSQATTYDLPVDQPLLDSTGLAPNLAGTSSMSGIRVPIGDRFGWAFYTEDGDQARIVSEEERKQGLMVASRSEDLFVVADCLVRHLAASGKSWAVFSMDMGRFVRRFDPITMVRMFLDRPRAFEHSAVPFEDGDKNELIRLFSEYYDESMLQARFRLRKFRASKNYSMFTVKGGFLINRHEGDTGLIYDIYVSPAHQGEGLGNELMKCALTDFNGRVSACYLHTSYPRAMRLYDKFGFKAVYSQLGIRLDEIVLERPSAK